MKNIIEDIQEELDFFFDDLNWTYILMFVMILYGIKHRQEFEWYNTISNSKNWESLKVWVAGLIVGGLFSLFRWLGENTFDSEYVSTLLRSWIVVIDFHSVIDKKISNIDNKEK